MNTPFANRPCFFVSYCVDDKKFVFETCNMLEPYLGRENIFFFEDHPNLKTSFLPHIKTKIEETDFVLFFIGKRFGPYQGVEFAEAIAAKKALLIVGIGNQKASQDFPNIVKEHAGGRHRLIDKYTYSVPTGTVACARDILTSLKDSWPENCVTPWIDWDESKLLNGLPRVPQLFDYEKNIIEFYTAKRLQEATENEPDDTCAKALQERLDKLFRERLDKLCCDWPTNQSDKKIQHMLENGMPADWPDVYRFQAPHDNHLDTKLAGDFRLGIHKGEALVRAAALMELDHGSPMTFPEAGPRPKLTFPRIDGNRQLNVAVLVAGGIAPGINAVIDALVQRHHAYRDAARGRGAGYTLRIFGVKNGFLAFSGPPITPHLVELQPEHTIEHATRGGSMLGTSTDEDLLQLKTRYRRMKEISRALSQEDRMIDILYVISGDGGMKAAHALWHFTNRNRPQGRQMVVVTIPKTMDNDILWVWQSFGFLSAVDESRKIVETLHTEVRSNPRLGIVQLFGSDSGFVVSHAVLASTAGHAFLALIPEIEFSAIGVARYLKKRLWRTAKPDDSLAPHAPIRLPAPTAPIDIKLPHGLVVMAETAVPVDALECLGVNEQLPEKLQKDFPELAQAYKKIAAQFQLTETEKAEISTFCERRKEGHRLEGQTSDIIRKLGLRIMAEALPVFLRQRDLLVDNEHMDWGEPDWEKLRVVCSEPRHLVRSLEPSTSDIIHGQRLGLLAVDAAMAGYTDCMISQWLTEFALVPLELVVLGRKRIPPQGMFWKSVISKTGQDSDLVAPWPRDESAPSPNNSEVRS
jgi:6-phosphofructokinase